MTTSLTLCCVHTWPASVALLGELGHCVSLLLGVVTALLQRLLFTSVVHVACCDMHNGSGAAPILRCWGGSNFLLRRWKFDLQSLFTWCLRGFTLKCLFSLVLSIPTSFSQVVRVTVRGT